MFGSQRPRPEPPGATRHSSGRTTAPTSPPPAPFGVTFRAEQRPPTPRGATMIHVRNTRLSGLVLATAFATSMMAGPAANAAGDETFNNAELSLRGGDAAAVAACVNFAKTWLTYDDAKKKKNERKRIAQANFCDNKAKAVGGDVTLEDVDILVTQK